MDRAVRGIQTATPMLPQPVNISDVPFCLSHGTDKAPTWDRMDTGSVVTLPDRFCTRIGVDPHELKRVYVTFGGYTPGNVWTMTEGTAPWTNLGGPPLPEAPVRALAIRPNKPEYLYLGTEVGLIVRENGGRNWSPAKQGPTD